MSLRRQSRRTGRGGGGAVEPPKIGILSISPPFATVNDGDTPMTITGFGFTATSVVRINGVDQTTGFGGPTTLTLTVFDALLDNPGFLNIEVFDPFYPASAGSAWPVNYNIPTTTSLSPPSTIQGSGDTAITIAGTNFWPASVAQANGVDLATTPGTGTSLSAVIPASMLGSITTISITVRNPTPGGGTSNAQTFNVTAAVAPPYAVAGLVYYLDATRYADAGAGSAAWTMANMSAVVATGPTPPTMTLTGTPTANMNLRVEITTGGALAVAMFRVSADAGATWAQSNVLCSEGTVINGVTITFAAGTFSTQNAYRSDRCISTMPSRDAADGTITTAKNLFQSTVARQPRLLLADPDYGGKPSIIGDLSTTIATTGSWTPASPTTIYLVVKPALAPTVDRYLLFASGNTSHPTVRATSGFNFQILSTVSSAIIGTWPTTPSIFVINPTAAGVNAVRIYKNKSLAFETTATDVGGSAGGGILTLGVLSSSWFEQGGSMMAMLMYSGTHSKADMDSIAGYLATQAGLTWDSVDPAPYQTAGLVYWLDPRRHADNGAGLAKYTYAAMGPVTATGTAPPTVTLSGTATAAVNMRIEITTPGAVGTALFRLSMDGGQNYFTGLTTAASAGPYAGITVAFSAGTYAADNVYTSNVRISNAPSRDSNAGTVNASKTAVQGTATNQPELIVRDAAYNNKATLRYGSSSVLTTGNWTASLPLTFFVVGHVLDTVANRDFWSAVTAFNVTCFNATGGNISTKNNSATAASSTVGTSKRVIVGRWAAGNPSAGSLWVSGGAAFTASSNGPGAIAGGVSIGVQNAGTIATVLIYAAALTLAEINAIANYLATEYGATWTGAT